VSAVVGTALFLAALAQGSVLAAGEFHAPRIVFAPVGDYYDVAGVAIPGDQSEGLLLALATY
jgi:hypothetical protein